MAIQNSVAVYDQRMSRPFRTLTIEPAQRGELPATVKRPKASQRDVRRASIILARSGGFSQQQTADLIGINRPVVAKWECRFIEGWGAGLAEACRSGRRPTGEFKYWQFRCSTANLMRYGICIQKEGRLHFPALDRKSK